jgi:regulatory protein
MPLITDICALRASRSQIGLGRLRGGSEWRLVVLEDGRRLRVDVEQVARHRLEPGDAVGPRVVARLEARDAYHRARERALRLLAIRPRSAAEVRARLTRDRVSETAIRAVIAGLAADGLLDDVAFARAWISRRTSGSSYGPRRIRWELREHGVPPAVIDRAFREAFADEGDPGEIEERSALALIRRRLRGYRQLAPDRRARRIAAFLERRGFSEATIVRILRMVDSAEERARP